MVRGQKMRIRVSWPLKNFQLLRCFKKLKLSHRNNYATTLNFFRALHLKFLNGLLETDFFNRLLAP